MLVFIRNRIWVVYPDRDLDLGIALPGDRAMARALGNGRYEVVKVSAKERAGPAA
ncbi:MAG TPA: hypothetical protein VG889_04095 [Rhizomicrobium sp.]|nr:hypothetical protein [Rhizomicrobium sp.]